MAVCSSWLVDNSGLAGDSGKFLAAGPGFGGCLEVTPPAAPLVLGSYPRKRVDIRGMTIGICDTV